jgi:hypothetical protein
MKLEDQVVSLELARKLKKLGVKQESLFCWMWQEDIERYELVYLPGHHQVATFTVAELGEMLPSLIDCKELTTSKIGAKWFICYKDFEGMLWADDKVSYFEEDTEADARAKLLVYLIENNLCQP